MNPFEPPVYVETALEKLRQQLSALRNLKIVEVDRVVDEMAVVLVQLEEDGRDATNEAWGNAWDRETRGE